MFISSVQSFSVGLAKVHSTLAIIISIVNHHSDHPPKIVTKLLTPIRVTLNQDRARLLTFFQNFNYKRVHSNFINFKIFKLG